MDDFDQRVKKYAKAGEGTAICTKCRQAFHFDIIGQLNIARGMDDQGGIEHVPSCPMCKVPGHA